AEEVPAADHERDDADTARRVREVTEELKLRDVCLAEVLVQDYADGASVGHSIADVDQEDGGGDDPQRRDRAIEEDTAVWDIAEIEAEPDEDHPGGRPERAAIEEQRSDADQQCTGRHDHVGEEE